MQKKQEGKFMRRLGDYAKIWGIGAAILQCTGTIVHAQSIIGLVGGQEETSNHPAYAALITSYGLPINLLQGSSGLPTEGVITSVAINLEGDGLIGGYYNSDIPYAAIVGADGTVTNLTGLPSQGIINAVAMNQLSIGLIGGRELNIGGAYGALIGADGSVSALTGDLPSNGLTYSVAINDSGVGLIGGVDLSNDTPFAGQVNAGVVSALTGGPLPSLGQINQVAINNSQIGLVAGIDVSTDPITGYAAQVSDAGVATNIFSGTSIPTADFLSIAINQQGDGIIGGFNTSSNAPYIARVASDLTVVTIPSSALPSTGSIKSVAINDQGVGLVGGVYFNPSSFGYAAFISADGSVDNIDLTAFASSSINSVAINNAGVGLIGGVVNSAGNSAFAALIAPNGTVTELPRGAGLLATSGTIQSVALNNNALEEVNPRSIGPYSSAINTQLAAIRVLETRLTTENRLSASEKSSEIAWLAQANDDLPRHGRTKESKYSLWAAPFGNYVHLESQKSIPAFTNKIAGVLAAFDYHTPDFLLGGGLGYAFNYLHYADGFGHGKIQEEMACLYGSYRWDHVWMNGVMWGGIYQFHNERHFLSFLTSTAYTHGAILSPHFEIAATFAIGDNNTCFIEPFAMADWTNSWQSHYQERGASGFNVVIDSQYASLLQSEAGLRLYETMHYCWGRCLFEEKLSYINQAPFHIEDTTAFFVGSASAFPVATGSSKVQNLGGAKLCCSFLPKDPTRLNGMINLEGLFGSSYQSYLVSLQIGKNF